MTERVDIDAIAPQLDAADALRIAGALAPACRARLSRSLWYPYHHVHASARLPAPFRSREFELTCLVDALDGRAATAGDCAPERRSVPPGDRLRPLLDLGQAEQAARRYLSLTVGRRLRSVADFGLRLHGTGTRYKLFWLVTLGDGQVLVDSVTGGWITMDARAA